MAALHFFSRLGHRSLFTALLAASELFPNTAALQAPCFTAVSLRKDISSYTCKREPEINGVLEWVITNPAAPRKLRTEMVQCRGERVVGPEGGLEGTFIKLLAERCNLYGRSINSVRVAQDSIWAAEHLGLL